MRSEILQSRDLEERNLGGPLRLQKLYSSSIQGRAAFFEYLRDAAENYERRLVIIKVRIPSDSKFNLPTLTGVSRQTIASLWASSSEGPLLGIVTLSTPFFELFYVAQSGMYRPMSTRTWLFAPSCLKRPA